LNLIIGADDLKSCLPVAGKDVVEDLIVAPTQDQSHIILRGVLSGNKTEIIIANPDILCGASGRILDTDRSIRSYEIYVMDLASALLDDQSALAGGALDGDSNPGAIDAASDNLDVSTACGRDDNGGGEGHRASASQTCKVQGIIPVGIASLL